MSARRQLHFSGRLTGNNGNSGTLAKLQPGGSTVIPLPMSPLQKPRVSPPLRNGVTPFTTH